MNYYFEDDTSLGITHAKAIMRHPDFQFIGAFDTDTAKRRKFQSKYQTKAFENLEEGLIATNPDFVIVAVPTEIHLETIRKVLEVTTPRIILCEKPLAYNSEDAAEIVFITKNRGVQLFVNYFRNSDSLIFRIKSSIQEGKYTLPFEATCRYSKGLLHTGTHFLNLLEIIFGEPKQVLFDLASKSKIHIQDPSLNVTLKFASGIVNLIPVGDDSELVFDMEIMFRNGKLSYLNEGSEVKFEGVGDSVRNTESALRNASLNSNSGRYQFDVLDEISNFSKQGSFRLCTGDDALRYVNQLKFN